MVGLTRAKVQDLPEGSTQHFTSGLTPDLTRARAQDVTQDFTQDLTQDAQGLTWALTQGFHG